MWSCIGRALPCRREATFQPHWNVQDVEVLERSTPASSRSLSLLVGCVLRTGARKYALVGGTSPNGRVAGTYLHGIFYEDEFRHAFLRAARKTCGLAPGHAPQLEVASGKRIRATGSDCCRFSRPKTFARPGWLGMAACCGGGEGMRVETLTASDSGADCGLRAVQRFFEVALGGCTGLLGINKWCQRTGVFYVPGS